MPKHLDARAQKEWRRLCPMLERLNVLTEADGRALANLCCDVSILEQAQEALTKTGLLAKSNRGLVHQSPILGIIATTTDRVTKGLREFGLTPASRSRIQTVGDGGAGDLAAIMATPRVRRAGAVPPVVN
jgi:P27 family predicted phage terminase small subunit